MLGLSPLTPAYGRDYKSKKALEIAFNADLDFMTPSGSYTNKSDLLSAKVKQIQVRYSKLRKTAVITISGPIVPIMENLDSTKHKPLKSITLRYYENNEDKCIGICKTCSKRVSHVEDDAENYECPRCGKNTVSGLGTLLMEGYVT